MPEAPAVHVTDSELARMITQSADEGSPLRVEINGKQFVLQVRRERQPARSVPSPDYDPDKISEVLDKYVGVWADMDVDQMIADLFEAREEGSRSADRP